MIDSTGADHLHGGEEAMLETLIGRLVMSGVTARAAVADTWGAAHALARHVAVPMHVAEPGTAEALLSPCPSRPCGCRPRRLRASAPWALSASAISCINPARP
ncbi:hypothetical protein ACFSYD_12780 [Paracoccus aerius]